MPDLWEQFINKSNFLKAWGKVKASQGSPGIDCIRVNQFEDHLEENLQNIITMLIEEQFRCSPMLKITLKKDKERSIVIPAVKDRVVQQALLQVIDPIFEPMFLDCSYAYRRGRSALKAIEQAERLINNGNHYLLKTDIAKFFDTIDHQILTAFIKTKINDGKILRLLEIMLAMQIFQNMTIYDQFLGIAQGSILSPLFSNIYLHPFDQEITTKNFQLIRYADDLIIMEKTQEAIESALQTVKDELKKLKLELNLEKTKITTAEDGFVFLGYYFDIQGKGPSRKAIEALNLRLKEIQEKGEDLPFQQRTENLAAAIRGWQNYYGDISYIPISNIEIFLALLLLAINSGELQQIPKLLTKRNNLQNSFPQTHIQLAEIFLKLGYINQALDEYGNAVISASDHNEIGDGIKGSLKIPEEEYSEVKEALFSAYNEPTYPGGFSELSEILVKNRLYELAKAAQEKFRELENQSPINNHDGLVFDVDKKSINIELTTEDMLSYLELFSGREGVYAAEAIDSQGNRSFVPIHNPLTIKELTQHLHGQQTFGVYLLRNNDTVKFMVIDIDISKKLLILHQNNPIKIKELLQSCQKDATRIINSAARFQIPAYIEDSGYKGRHCWFFFTEPVKASQARDFARKIHEKAGSPSGGITWEVFPSQDRVKFQKVGCLIKLPWGIHSKSKRITLFVDENSSPYEDQAHFLRGVEKISPAALNRLLNTSFNITNHPLTFEISNSVDRLQFLADLPLVIKLVAGCKIIEFLAKKAKETAYLTNHERTLLLLTMGHLGEEGKKGIHRIIQFCINYNHEITEKYIQKLLPSPISCPRVREQFKELTASLGCDCHFRIPSKGYPSPILHAIKAIPPTLTKERKIVNKNPQIEEIEHIVNKIAELRRNLNGVKKNIEKYENELGELFQQKGIDSIEITTGVLYKIVEGDKISWRIEV